MYIKKKKKILPVNVEVKLALLFQLGEQLLFRLSDSHAFSKHCVHKELAGLGKKQMNKMIHSFDYNVCSATNLLSVETEV